MVLDLIENQGLSTREVSKLLMEKYSIRFDQTAVARLRRNKTTLIKSLSDPSMPVGSKSIRNMGRNQELDSAVYKWCCELRNNNGKCKAIPISNKIIKIGGLKFAKQFNISNFKASDGWVSRSCEILYELD